MLNTAEYDRKLNALIERGAGADLEQNEQAVNDIVAEIAQLIMYCNGQGLVLRTDSDGYMHFVENGLPCR